MLGQVKCRNILTPFGTISFEDLVFKKGNAMALDSDFKEKPYYRFLSSNSRDWKIALQERITKPFEDGMLTTANEDGIVKFDDRAFRFDRMERSNKLNIFIGPTHFKEFLETNLKAIHDRKLYERLVKEGNESYGQPNAMFADILATNAGITINNGETQGMLFVRRSNKVKIYPNHWHVIGGKMEYSDCFFTSQTPSATFKRLAKQNIAKECKEELGLTPHNTRLVGLVHIPTGLNLNFLADSNLSSEQLENCLNTAVDSWECREFFVTTPKEIANFLIKNASNFVPAGFHAGLAYLYEQGQFDDFNRCLQAAEKMFN